MLFNFLSNAVTLISLLGQKLCILTWVGLNRVFPTFFLIIYIYIYYFFLSTFQLLQIEFQICSFHFSLCGAIMFLFDLLRIGFQTFFAIFVFMRLSQFYVYGREVYELTLFNQDFFQFRPSTLNCLIIWVGSCQLFYFIIFYQFIHYYYIFYLYYLNYRFNQYCFSQHSFFYIEKKPAVHHRPSVKK